MTRLLPIPFPFRWLVLLVGAWLSLSAVAADAPDKAPPPDNEPPAMMMHILESEHRNAQIYEAEQARRAERKAANERELAKATQESADNLYRVLRYALNLLIMIAIGGVIGAAIAGIVAWIRARREKTRPPPAG